MLLQQYQTRPLFLVLQAPASDAGHVTAADLTPDIPVKPAAHSIGTQTTQPPSAAAAFFIRSVNTPPHLNTNLIHPPQS